MSVVDHLHDESKILPVRPRNRMLTQQFWLRSHHPQHPNYHITVARNPLRHVKANIREFCGNVSRFIAPGSAVAPVTIRAGIAALHTEAVQGVMSELRPNKVLEARPPPINIEESSLPRRTRSILAQLRSGHSYKSRIDAAFNPLCPICGHADQTTAHLFLCRPTMLIPRDLWVSPVAAAAFLSLPP